MLTVVNSEHQTQKNTNAVPGFSHRLNFLFDAAGVPSDTRLTWGHNRWGVVQNTVKNWIKGDTPPKSFATLQIIVQDLLTLIGGDHDKTAVIGWLYSGGQNPLAQKDTSNRLSNINHVLQVKIFNMLFDVAAKQGFNLNDAQEDQINLMVSSLYEDYLVLLEKDKSAKISGIIESAKLLISNAMKHSHSKA